VAGRARDGEHSRASATSPDHFPATLGARERLSSLGAVGLGVVGLLVVGIGFTVSTGRPEWLFLSLPFTLVLYILGRLAPSGYRLAADGVHIERRIGDRVIPYRTIRGVDRAPRPLSGLSLFASTGVFGRFGQFWNPRLGLYRLFLTNRYNVVWLATDAGWVALSPDRPDEFVDRLNARLRA
jgi:hypothetical protein